MKDLLKVTYASSTKVDAAASLASANLAIKPLIVFCYV
jgi:hypothetical protein